MIVDIDAGNTRSKWQAHSDGAVIASGAVASAGQQLIAAIEAAGVQSPTRVRIASVRDNETLAELQASIKTQWHIIAELATTTARACGIINSYAQPHTMGIDRWLAVLAAARLVGMIDPAQPDTVLKSAPAFCVIDAGSAITLDFVAADGVHRGGYIAPGYQLQLQALLSGTGRIDVDTQQSSQQLAPANNTADAVLAGVLLSLCGLITSGLNRFADSADTVAAPTVLITGGDALRLQPHLDFASRYEPDLVLQGLSLLLP